MFLPRSFLLRLVLENTIAPPPITVTPDVLVTEAIALLNSSSGNFDPGMGANDCTGCLAVVSENQLMGLFSERVVTRLVASGRSLAGVTLAEVIEPPAIALRQSELTNPDVALSLLQKHQIQHLPILDDNGQLLGLLTYESLCRLLQPVEPDRPDEASIAALKLQTERSQLLMAVSTRIRASLSLAEILNATVSEVRQFLGCDRVSIYHFLENGQFQVVAESLAAGQRSFVSEEIYDPCFAPDWTERYGQGRVRVVSDIYTAGMTPCHVELLEHLQIRAKILVPAIVNNQFWGLVSASESAVPRDWQPAEVTFLEQLGIQVAIAIQHSETAARFQQQGQELTALLDRSPDVIFRLNRDLHYLYLNAAVEVELGYAPEALIGQPLLAATLAPEHLAEWQTLTQQVAATRQEQTIEYQLRLQSRSIWFQTRVVPEYNMDGTVTSFLCVARNITQKKQAEARQAAYINVLLEWQNRHHAAQLATKQVLYEWDTSSNRMMWGINAEQVFGYNASEMPQTSADWFASIHPEDEKRVQTAVAEYFEHQGHLYLQYRWQHQAGHYIWIETQAQFFADANGNLTQIIGYVTDINEKKRLEAERTQLETALRESEAQLRQIFDNSQDVFFLKSLDSKQMIYTSPAWEYLYQTPLQQTYDNPQSWLDFIHPDDRDGVVTFNQQACQGKEVCSFAYRIIRPDNSIRWLWNRSFPIRNEAGEIYRLAGANIDITEQKKLELELSVVKERYQLAIRGIGEGVWDWDLVSDRVIASDRYWEILGYPSPAKNAWKFADEMLREEIHPDDRDLMQLTLKGHLEDHLPYEVEFRRRKQSGEYIWCRSRGEAIRDQTGKPIRMVGAIADITERKVMATALQASEETLRLVVNTVPGVVYTYCRCVDGTKSFRFISQGIIKLCDRTPEEILNDSQVLWHLIVPEDAERMRDLIDQSAAMLTPWTAEFRLITASKVLKWVFGHSIPSRQADGSIIWHGILIDISDRKHAEAKLRQQEEFLRSIYTGAELAIFVIEVSIDQEFRFLEFNPVAERYGSVTCEEIQGKTPEEAFGEAVGSAIRQKYVLCLKSGQKISYEEYISFPGGSIWALTNLFPIRSEAGNIHRIIGTAININDRKQAEAALRTSEQTLSQVMNTVPGAVFKYRRSADAADGFVFISQGIVDLYEHTPEEILNNGRIAWDIVLPEDMEQMSASRDRAAATLDPWEMEFRIRTASGVLKWILGHSIPSQEEDGSIVWCGIFTDISDRKQAELERQRSEALLQALIAASPVGLTLFDRELRYLYGNEALAKINDLPLSEHLGHTLWEVFPEMASQFAPMLLQVIETQVPVLNLEFSGEVRPGVFRSAISNHYPVCLPNGEVIGVGVSVMDITELVQAQQKLRESEARFRTLADNISQFAWITDEHGWIEWYNQRWFDYTGTTLAKMQGWGWQQVHHPDHVDRVVKKISHCFETGEIWEDTFPLRGRDGQYRWFLSRAIPIRDQQGRVLRWFGTNTDITEQKQTEIALQTSEQILRQLTNMVPGAVYKYQRLPDGSNNLIFMSEGIVDLYEYTPEELLKDVQIVWDIIFPEDIEKIGASIDRSAATLEAWEMEFRIRTPSGILKWISGHSIPSQEEDGSIIWFGILTDISDRKQAELALQASERRYLNLAELSPVGIFHTDPSGDCKYVNSRWCQLAGLSFNEAMDMGWKRALHPEDRDWVFLNWQRATQSQTPFLMECRFQRPDGKVHWLICLAIVETDTSGNVIGYIGTITDITERKYSEQALRESEQRYRDLAEAMPQMVWLTDETGAVNYFNQRWYDYTGQSQTEAMGLGGAAAIHPDERDRTLQEWEEAIATGSLFESEYRVRHHQGLYRWFLGRGIPIRNQSREITGWVGTVTDIDDFKRTQMARKQAELALQASEAKLNDVLNSAGASIGHFRYYPNGFWETDYHSKGCERVFGYRPEEFLAEVWLSNIVPEDWAVIQERMQAAIKAERETTLEYRFYHPDGSTRWILDTLTSRWNESNHCWFVTAIGTDDSDRKHAELELQKLNQELEARIARRTAALSESEVRYRSLFEQAAVGISQSHPSGRYIQVNQRFCQLTGYTQSELLDMSWQDLIHLEDLEVIQGELAHLHHGELASITLEIRYIRKDRRLQWVSLTVSMLYNAAGTLIGDLAVVEDISDRKHIEQQLQNSEKRLKKIISKTVDGILILNSQGQILFSNPAADRIFNCQKADYQGADLGISITLQKTFELEIPHPTGRVTTVEVRVEEITWQDRKAFLAAIRDISHRKQTEIDLQASELSYRTLAENLPGIVYKLYPDRHNTFVFFNDRLTTLFQLDPIDIANQGTLCPVNSLIVPEDRDRVIEVIQAAIANQQPFQVEYCIYIPATQEKRYLLEQGSTVTDDIGQALHIVGIIFDVTQIKQTEEQLRKINERLTIANAELARATRLKDEFLANMSHELRTPLNSILGLSEVLEERTYGDLTEQQHHTLTTIQTNGQHLLELINDILDLAKIESGKLDLQITPVSVEQLCRSTIPFIQQQTFKKQISFTLELSPNLPDIELDERLIRQVLINLLTNAIKFTPNGGAVILKVQGNAAEQTVSFSAIDTGIGIAPENIDKLFQPFVQIDSSLSRRYAGTGLGLALVRRIIELHKGSVKVRSTVGQGSEFIVMLPWKQVNQPNSDKPVHCTTAIAEIASPFLPVETKNTAENVVKKPVVLLVDDNLDNIETLQAYLELKGFNIVVAHNGLQAIHLTQMQSFNLILMDIQMPDMNGLEAIRQIRSQEQYKHTPILAVTALAMSGDKEKCLAVGANDYLTKPISPIHLVNTMKKYLQLC
ncbi:PAS domain S-box protein [Nostoc sp. DedQUE07]|uniref:PAS domain S-box protein n=1 Tax=Nostoc sp. DedQUE07 TaxID=3075392 RepID=UPI002AD2519F|nr:PAS domain S-box protein [Nostoc sp. DedQUE07]MDZ8128675.1 PAS domain S-box protein [Nostoc sp. DedQUE07]